MARSPLKKYRKENGLSLAQLGQMFRSRDGGPFNKMTISRWENAKVPLHRVLAVERVTGIPRYILRPEQYATGKRR